MPDSHDVFAALRQPIEAFFDPAERVFVPALLSAVLLVWMAFGWRLGTRRLIDGLLARRIWTHASCRADIVMLFARALILGVVKIPWLAGTVAASLWVGLTLYRLFGPADVFGDLGRGNFAVVAVVYTAVLFVAWDFSRFALHWAMHRFETLWSFHQVHHSAEVMTPLTLYRVHPVESLLYDLRGLVTTAAVTGSFLYLFAGTAQELQLLGINAVGFLFNLAAGNLRHSHVWLRFGWLERFVLSPAQHQMHHARDLLSQQSNYGTWLAVWDRWMGTWRPAPDTPVESFGVEDAHHRPDSVLSMLVAPFVELAPKLGRRWPRGASVAALGVLLLPGRSLAQPVDGPTPTPG